jgi:hypothetical protein
MVRLPGGVWSADDDLQSLRALSAAWGLGSSVPGACPKRSVDRPADDRFNACQSAPISGGWKRGEQKQAVGRSRGGRNTKIHALADAKGRLIAILLTGGEAHDCPVAERLIRRAKQSRHMLGDKAYDSAEWATGCMNVEPSRSFPIAAIGRNRSASTSISTSFVGASRMPSAD